MGFITLRENMVSLKVDFKKKPQLLKEFYLQNIFVLFNVSSSRRSTSPNGYGSSYS